jgi:RNA polymerase sigma-70 factor (ECF subfamily)
MVSKAKRSEHLRTGQRYGASPKRCDDGSGDLSSARGSQQFADALLAHLPTLRRYAVSLAGNVVLADDLVQDCVERALRQAAQLRELPRVAGWLRRIMYNLYIDEMRRRKNKGKEQDIDNLMDHLELSVPASDPGVVRNLARAMNQLSVEHRDILVLVSVEELNYREISEELNIPQGTVMSRLARARDRLRSIMEAESTKVANLGPVSKERL